jgi:hypothetical protein
MTSVTFDGDIYTPHGIIVGGYFASGEVSILKKVKEV